MKLLLCSMLLLSAAFAETQVFSSVGSKVDPDQWAVVLGGPETANHCSSCHASNDTKARSFIVPTKLHKEINYERANHPEVGYVVADHPDAGSAVWFIQKAKLSTRPIKRAWLHFHGYNEVGVSILRCEDDLLLTCKGAPVPGLFHGADVDVTNHLTPGAINLIQMDARADGPPALIYDLVVESFEMLLGFRGPGSGHGD